MKSYKLWGAAAPLWIGALVACGGESSIGRGDPMGSSGRSSTGSTGAAGSDGPNGEAGMNAGLGAKTGTGATNEWRRGRWDADSRHRSLRRKSGMRIVGSDCPVYPAQLCADGSKMCQKSYCGGGRCQVDPGPYCPYACSDDRDSSAGVSDSIRCIDCGDGTGIVPDPST